MVIAEKHGQELLVVQKQWVYDHRPTSEPTQSPTSAPTHATKSPVAAPTNQPTQAPTMPASLQEKLVATWKFSGSNPESPSTGMAVSLTGNADFTKDVRSTATAV
jgi:hypothetical protein